MSSMSRMKLWQPWHLQVCLFFTNPVCLLMLAWALRGESIGAMGLGGVGCSLLGVVLVSQPPFLFQGAAVAPWTLKHVLGKDC